MVIDLHAQNQVNICKDLGKNPENCLTAEIYQVSRPVISQKKSVERNKTHTRSVKHGD